MFSYNATAYTIEDGERALVVNQTGGPGHGVYAGLMTSPKSNWTLRFLVHRSEGESDEGDSRVLLKLTVYPPKGDWDRMEAPTDLARDAAVARETGFYGTAPQSIQTN